MNQLHEMLSRYYTRKDYMRFLTLARRMVRRMKKEREEGEEQRKLDVFRLLGLLPEIRQRIKSKEIAATMVDAERG